MARFDERIPADPKPITYCAYCGAALYPGHKFVVDIRYKYDSEYNYCDTECLANDIKQNIGAEVDGFIELLILNKLVVIRDS